MPPSMLCIINTGRHSAWSHSTCQHGSLSVWACGLLWTHCFCIATVLLPGHLWSSMCGCLLRTTVAMISPGPCIALCHLACGVVHHAMMCITCSLAPILLPSLHTGIGWQALPAHLSNFVTAMITAAWKRMDWDQTKGSEKLIKWILTLFQNLLFPFFSTNLFCALIVPLLSFSHCFSCSISLPSIYSSSLYVFHILTSTGYFELFF